MFEHSFSDGVVWHKRHSPKVHQFSYKLNSWLINLQKLDQLDNNSRLINRSRAAIYRFQDRHYLRDSNGDLLQRIRSKFIDLGGGLNGEESFYLLGQLSNLGVYFSPLNLYFCYAGEVCTNILAEVSNTPWNERHYYLLDPNQPQIISKKNFHVSPFFGLNQEYHWQFDLTKQKISFKIDSYQEQKLVFSAGYNGNLIPVTSSGIKFRLIKSPFMVYKIIFGIYFEALRIWLKKIRFVPHPKYR